jgi:N-terminal domain of (some) glycogen debranching enzymes
MTFKVQVGPAQIAIHQGQTVLVTEPDGQVIWPSERGLYFRDTRVISAWAIYLGLERRDVALEFGRDRRRDLDIVAVRQRQLEAGAAFVCDLLEPCLDRGPPR